MLDNISKYLAEFFERTLRLHADVNAIMQSNLVLVEAILLLLVATVLFLLAKLLLDRRRHTTRLAAVKMARDAALRSLEREIMWRRAGGDGRGAITTDDLKRLISDVEAQHRSEQGL